MPSTAPSLQTETLPRRPAAARRDFASRLFGYDVFISFALGPPPRGSLSYASDLARRLRERDFTVFFSEDEAPPGEQLDGTLRRALHSSRALVVVANRGTLQVPRWVRQEVESFRQLTPARVVIPISIDGALLDPALAETTAAWLPYKDRIWLDETQQAADAGLASDEVVERLALAPRRSRSNVKWRWLVRAVGVALLALAVGMAVAAYQARQSEQRALASESRAVDSDSRARAELQRAASLRAVAEASDMVSGERPGGHERAFQQLLAAHALLGMAPEVASAMQAALAATPRQAKLLDTGTAIFAAAASPLAGDTLLVTAGSGGRVQRWALDTLTPIGTPLAGPTKDVYSVAISPDGQVITAAGIEGLLWRWDAKSGAPLATPATPAPAAGADPDPYRTPIRSLVFLPDGQHIVSGQVGGTLQLWRVGSGEPVGDALETGADVVTSVAVSPDGQRLLAGGDFGALSLWGAAPGGWAELKIKRTEGEPMPSPGLGDVAFSPDGKRAATIDDAGALQFFVRDGGTLRATGAAVPAHPVGRGGLRYSPDGRLLLSGGVGGTLLAWDAVQGQHVGDWLRAGAGTLPALAFSADGKVAASGGEDGLLRLWSTGPEPRTATPLPGQAVVRASEADVGAMWVRVALPPAEATSPDATLRAKGLKQGAVLLSDARSGEPRGLALAGHDKLPGLQAYAAEAPHYVRAVAFSANGTRLVSGSENGSVRLWTVNPFAPTGALLLGHQHGVISLAFSPDGAHVATGDADGMLRFWSTAAGAALGVPVRLHADSVRSLAFSADGKQLVALDVDGMGRAWPAPAAWAAELCAKLTRNMSRRQWNAWISSEIPYREQCPGLPVPP